MSQKPPTAQCWILSDGRKGMENQCVGLAQAVGLPYEIKHLHPNAPWKWLPEKVFGRPWPFAMAALDDKSDPLEPPWPDLLIACGRQTVAYSIAIRRLSGGKTFTVQTQDPRIAPKYFDLVIPPKHDRISGPNVVPIVGSPNLITRDRLASEAAQFSDQFGHLARPLVSVIIGGDSRHYKLTGDCLDWLCDQLIALDAQGFGLAITTSRRTGHTNERHLAQRLKDTSAYIWNGVGPNPYFALLGLADFILVTEESTNMVTEAAGTGKPVHVVPLTGGSEKFNFFHKEMREIGAARPFVGELETWNYEPLNETARMGNLIRSKLGGRNRG